MLGTRSRAHSPGAHLRQACRGALVSLVDPAGGEGALHQQSSGLNMTNTPPRCQGPPDMPPAHLLPSGHLVTYLLSMRANGTLRPGETLHTGKEKSQGPTRWALSSSQHPPLTARAGKT